VTIDRPGQTVYSHTLSLESRYYVEEALDALADGASLAYPDAAHIVWLWHNDNHPGTFMFCDRQPCHAIAHARTA
jgi:hypothetical protein